MVSTERIERSKLHPSLTQFRGGVVKEPTHICSDLKSMVYLFLFVNLFAVFCFKFVRLFVALFLYLFVSMFDFRLFLCAFVCSFFFLLSVLLSVRFPSFFRSGCVCLSVWSNGRVNCLFSICLSTCLSVCFFLLS